MLARPMIVALLGALGFIGCAPPALDPDRSASTARERDNADDDEASTTDDDEDTAAVGDDDEDTGTGTGTGTGSAVPATFKKVYAALKTDCGSCHLGGAGGAPIFFGANEASSYTAFKDNGFVATPSPLTERGAHAGRALSSGEIADVEAWVAGEE